MATGINRFSLPVFGKAEWFHPHPSGRTVTPSCWQGWVYTAAWSAALIIPLLYLVIHLQIPEALFWMIASVAALLWDVTQMRRSEQQLEDLEVQSPAKFPPRGSHVATRHFDLYLRQ